MRGPVVNLAITAGGGRTGMKCRLFTTTADEALLTPSTQRCARRASPLYAWEAMQWALMAAHAASIPTSLPELCVHAGTQLRPFWGCCLQSLNSDCSKPISARCFSAISITWENDLISPRKPKATSNSSCPETVSVPPS